MRLADEAATRALGAALARSLRIGDVVALSGPLGVGKTALARAILHAAGHVGEVPSPTFAIVQPYEDLPLPIWHADLYRIDDPAELAEIGLDEARQFAVLMVEWPEKAGAGAVASAWPDALHLTLAFADDGARELTATVPAPWEARWPPR